MTKVKSLIYGIYPRSEPLRNAISKWERKTIDQVELSAEILKEKKALLELFREEKIWGYTDPLSNWNDVLRGISGVFSQITLGRLTRYKETNTFYRQPCITGYPGFSDTMPTPDHDTYLPGDLFLQSEAHYFHFLPGIDSFLNMSLVDHSLDTDKLQEHLVAAYKEIAAKYGIRDLVLYEPYPSHRASRHYNEIFSRFKTYYVIGDLPSGYFEEIENEPYSIITSNRERFSDLCSHTAVPGLALFDSQNTRIEDPSSVRSELLKMAESNGIDEAIVSHTEYLDFLPRSIADKKVGAIGSAGDVQ